MAGMDVARTPSMPTVVASPAPYTLGPDTPKAASLRPRPATPCMSTPNSRFKELIDRYGARIEAAVRRRIGPDSGVEAEDIAQEVRLKLWQIVESDRNQPLAASYIERVIVTTVIDAWRRSKATLTESIDVDDPPQSTELLEEGSQGPDSTALRRQWLAAVDACLAGLNDRRRLVLKLYLRGFSTAEMAPLLALNDDATRRLLHRALEQLKTVLRERGLEEIE